MEAPQLALQLGITGQPSNPAPANHQKHQKIWDFENIYQIIILKSEITDLNLIISYCIIIMAKSHILGSKPLKPSKALAYAPGSSFLLSHETYDHIHL
jgi:hypothetical protein